MAECFFVLLYQYVCANIAHYFLAICSIKILIIPNFHRLFVFVGLFVLVFIFVLLCQLFVLIKVNWGKKRQAFVAYPSSLNTIFRHNIYADQKMNDKENSGKKRDCFGCTYTCTLSTLATLNYGIAG